MNAFPPLPKAFVERMRVQLGGESEAFFAALEASSQRGIHMNPRKPLPLGDEPDGLLEPIPWEPNGYWLSTESQAGSHPIHEAGAYYLQEPSAMIPTRILAPQPGERVLDLCAAPGGKSIQLADMLMGQGLLVCNEPVQSRAAVLSRNVERMGLWGTLVVCADPDQLARVWSQAFDAILVDAPCSGEGMFRRHPETRLQWQENSPAGCGSRQRRILASAHQLLRPGGRLVYSTCTFSPEENGEMIAWFRGEYPDMKPMEFSVPVGDDCFEFSKDGMLQVYPHRIRGEGHFVAMLGKENLPADSAPFLPPGQALRPPSPLQLDAFRGFLGRADESAGEPLLPLPNALLGETLLYAPPLPPLGGIKVLRAGLHLGSLKGKSFVPNHALALGLDAPYSFPTVSLSHASARAYQRGETLPMEDAPGGFVLMTYRGIALGWAKGNDGQLKNHYPKGLRRP